MIFSDHLSRNIDTNADKPSEPICEGLDLKIRDVYLNASDDKCLSLTNEMSKDFGITEMNSQYWMD